MRIWRRQNETQKRFSHIHLFSHICIGVFVIGILRDLAAVLVEICNLAFSAEIVNVGQNYSIVQRRIDKDSLQVLVG